MPKSQPPTTIADHLTAKERVALFLRHGHRSCAVGTLSSTMQLTEIRGLIARDSNTRRFQLTDIERADCGLLLERAGSRLAE